ncbi:hypothetical protein CJU90_0569 [Yarrowia sp. C11]|nr:hypothetical protein CJU90_0569 [Yarrowia sp. C11]
MLRAGLRRISAVPAYPPLLSQSWSRAFSGSLVLEEEKKKRGPSNFPKKRKSKASMKSSRRHNGQKPSPYVTQKGKKGGDDFLLEGESNKKDVQNKDQNKDIKVKEIKKETRNQKDIKVKETWDQNKVKDQNKDQNKNIREQEKKKGL